MNTEIRAKIESFLSNLKGDIDYKYHIDIDDLSLDTPDGVFEEIRDQLDNANAFNIEIIYYTTAIEYLQENDPSLRTSLDLASDMGYEAKDLNSEILASLLASQNARKEFEEQENETTSFFEEIAEEIATEEEEDEEEENTEN